jgi:uncharacterized SAM-binding protein YcdF (DUF218 family)
MAHDTSGRSSRLVTRFLALVGLIFLLVTFSPFVSWYAATLGGHWSDDRADVLVVLSAAGPNSGVMDASTYWRCFMAVVFYREHPYRQIIVSGKDSAPGMRDFLVFSGIPADRIVVENQAGDTHENALFTARLLAGTTGRFVLLTSDSHMFRARRSFARAGVTIGTLPVPDVIKRAADYSARPGLFMGEMNETASIVYYWLRGWI